MAQKPFSDLSFEQYLAEEKLMGSRCKTCGTLYLPPRPICIGCHGADMEWVQMKGEGRVAAFTCIAICPPAMLAEGYNRDNPYCTGVVALEEGVRVDARLEEVDPREPESIHVGMPVSVKYVHRDDGSVRRTTLAFRPSQA